MGALAALRYRAEPRLTTDLDLLVQPAAGLTDAFRAEGFTVHEFADPGDPPHMALIRGKGIRADLLFAVVEYQRVALDRAVDHVISAEDVIVHKLIAWRHRDQDDVASILRTGRLIDEPYVEQWARQWEVADRWEEALRSR